jgi:predicted metal-dependent peptidase
MSTPHQDAMDKAKYKFFNCGKSVFLTTILFSLKFEWSTDIPTAATNGIHLLVNPDFFMSLNAGKMSSIDSDERLFLLAHEAWHVAFKHMLRLEERDHKLWNMAADYVINYMLVSKGYSMPAGGLYDRQYAGMNTEEVYTLLKKNNVDSSNFEPDLQNNPNATPEQQAALDAQVSGILAKAATQAKLAKEQFGDLPGDVQVGIDELLNPKLNWTTILQNYMTQFDKSDYSYRRPNKRFMPDFYLPSLYGESVANIAVAVDSSGSVSDAEFTAFVSEIESIRRRLNPEIVEVVAFDTAIRSSVVLNRSTSISNVTFSGRGGTRLSPVFDHFNKKPPTVLIVFSDLDCTPMRDKPKYPVIWIAVNAHNPHVEFGKLIEMNL